LTGESPAPSPPAPTPPETKESASPPLPESKEGTPPPASLPGTKETLIPPPPAPARERKPSAPPSSLTIPESPHPEQKATPRPLIERELRGPEELAYREKARRESEEQRLEEGIRTCLEGLEKYPDSPYLLYLLGSLVSAQGKDTDALGIFDHLIAIHPDFAEAYLARGRIRRRAGDATGAEQDLAKARELEPGLIVRD
ncbi:MAG: hypothetical protein LUQ17_00790, partial [Methanomicrobiales archaeon]|nr:hypothetical protein [Methanomicrobiales archaeon]